MVQPIGLSIVGGLTSSTFVTLFIIPVLYSLVMKEKKSVDTGVAQALADFVIGEGGDIETGAVPPSANAVQSGDVPAEQDYVQAGIVANQSVEDDIIETLEQAVPDIRYTIIPTVNGRGGDNYKLGTATWPEQNFMMIAYMKRKNVATVSAAVRMLKKKFPKEGIKLFLV